VPTADAGAIYPSFLPGGRLLYVGVTPAGRKLLQESGLELVAAADLTDAARKVVAAARKSS